MLFVHDPVPSLRCKVAWLQDVKITVARVYLQFSLYQIFAKDKRPYKYICLKKNVKILTTLMRLLAPGYADLRCHSSPVDAAVAVAAAAAAAANDNRPPS